MPFWRQTESQEYGDRQSPSFHLDGLEEGLWRMWYLSLPLHYWVEIGRWVMGLRGILNNGNRLSEDLGGERHMAFVGGGRGMIRGSGYWDHSLSGRSYSRR